MPPGSAPTPSRPLEVVTREKPKPAGIAGASPNLSRGTPRRQTPVVPPVPGMPPQQPIIKTEKDVVPKKVFKESPVPLPVVPGMAPATSKPSPLPPTQKIQILLPSRPDSSDGAVAERAAEPLAVTPRGRGRPKGWKPGMSYASMRGNKVPEGVTATARRGATRQSRPDPGFGIIKRRGRPPKQPSPPPRAVYHELNVAFIAFLCEWRGCKAELHNLETLRKHVEVVHVRPQREVGGSARGLCQWGRCGDVVKVEGVERETFDSVTELRMHIGEQHLVPFGWHVGDGPRNRSGAAAFACADGTEEEDIPGYLKDALGNQVTPSIKDQQVEDYLTWRANRQRLRELLLKREENLPSEESDLSDGAQEE
ncbi:unnamed protein product [Clonostachys rosea]|uniref:C2H2-type domain-containing protein n=1 Tax=Bionectria ochroleuca TaxID=29856 RepID=A0ABY6UGJ0_BIOOC|nr:unnamed protein product [Clonostachys rosea]